MNTIKSMTGELISDHIRDAVPAYERKKIENQLLDGSFNVQTVGDPFRILNVTTLGNQETTDRLNYAEAIGEKIRVEVLGKRFDGWIRSQISWSESAVNYYEGDFVLLVDFEGAI